MIRRFTSAPNPCLRVRLYLSFKVFASSARKPYAHAVVPARFELASAVRDEIINRHGVFSVRKAHVYNLRATPFTIS